MHLHLCARWRSRSPCQSSADYGNTKTPSVHRRLGNAILSQLAFPGEDNLNLPWEKSHWDNTVVKSKSKKVIHARNCRTMGASYVLIRLHFAVFCQCTDQRVYNRFHLHPPLPLPPEKSYWMACKPWGYRHRFWITVASAKPKRRGRGCCCVLPWEGRMVIVVVRSVRVCALLMAFSQMIFSGSHHTSTPTHEF